MKQPDFSKEQSLLSQGYKTIVGIDEVGRGAWAGPLVAAACVLNVAKLPEKIRDSKQMSPDARVNAAQKIRECAEGIGIGSVAPFEIDLFGLTMANQLAFRRALTDLRVKCDYILADGFIVEGSTVACEGIVKGDQSILSIAAASVIAKVARDNMMQELDKQFPVYGFARHVGYGTPEHMEAIKKHGITPDHRKLFLRNLFANI